jgi:riboflavin kinase, archaea type
MQNQKPFNISGKVISGARRASFFTQIDWVQSQCLEKLGFKPFPGTLNIEAPDQDFLLVEALRNKQAIQLIPPDKGFCVAKVYPAVIDEISIAVIIPQEDVRIHGKHIVEILSGVKLRDALRLKDGDVIEVRIPPPVHEYSRLE